MRASISLTTADDPEEGMPLKGEWDDWLPVVSAIGYGGVELSFSTTQNLPAEELFELLETNRLEVSAFATGRSFTEWGLSLCDPDDDRRWAAVERMKSFIELAENDATPVVIGRARGGPVHSGKNAIVRLEESVCACVDFALEKNVRLWLAPLPRDVAGTLCTVKETIEFIDRLGVPNLGVMFDTRAVYLAEGKVAEGVQLAGGLIGGVRLSDSNGLLPTKGEIDFRKVFRRLIEAEFDGYVTANTLPEPTAAIAAEKTFKFLSNLVER